MDLTNKIAVITGVSKGIGYAATQAMLQKGAKVAGLGMNKPNIEDPNFLFVKTDVRKYGEVEKGFERVFEKWGRQIHVLINNAGLGYFGYLEETGLKEFHEIFETNVFGTFYCCKIVLPLMKAAEEGHIINISSTAGVEAYPQVGAYCASKFAVKAMSESLYKEVREFKVKVTCVYPGSVKTDFFRNSPGIKAHDYMLMPEDIATAFIQILETPDNFHVVNYEVRPLQPKGPRKS